MAGVAFRENDELWIKNGSYADVKTDKISGCFLERVRNWQVYDNVLGWWLIEVV